MSKFDDIERARLGLAIELRIRTREAIYADDMTAVAKWNRLADSAYASLSPFDAKLYAEWVFEGLDRSEFFGSGGDA